MYALALQLAEKMGDKKDAVRLRGLLAEAEEAYPVAAVQWRLESQALAALQTALAAGESLGERLRAVDALRSLAMPPLPGAFAEEALLQTLREVSGEGARELRAAAEQALLACWSSSGDDRADVDFDAGRALLEQGLYEDAVLAFTGAVSASPGFAEALRCRGAARLALASRGSDDEFEKALEDFEAALALNANNFSALAGCGTVHIETGGNSEAAFWFRRALQVHPFLRRPREELDRLGRKHDVARLVKPRIEEAMDLLKHEESPVFREGEGAGLWVAWDVHRVEPGLGRDEAEVTDEQELTYFFRAAVRNPASCSGPVRSLDCFYAIQFVGGQVFHLPSPTTDRAEYLLEPRDEYRYCWTFTVREPIVGMLGGMIFERMDRAGGSDDERFACPCLELLVPAEASVVPAHALEALGRGHVFMGQVDLTQVTET